MSDDKRLIEDYLPIDAISTEAVREKSVRQGHISTIHLWWARRPLVACRAAVYATMVPAPEDPKGRGGKSQFMQRLCKHPGDQRVFAEARKHVAEAHANRQAAEATQSSQPKVLDLFSGGGAISLEASRLGAQAFAIELNPVAYLINLCTVVYPQQFGKPDATTTGSSRANQWSGLVEEFETWGRWVHARVAEEIGDLYPPVQDPSYKGKPEPAPQTLWHDDAAPPPGHLRPVAYLWTRTARCRNPGCQGQVPLARHSWLCCKENKSGGRYIAVKPTWDKSTRRVRYSVVQADSEDGFDFDPNEGSRGGAAVCPGCHSPLDDEYVKQQGSAKQFGHQLMAVVCDPPSGTGRKYVDPHSTWEITFTAHSLLDRARSIAQKHGTTVPDEPLEANPRSFDIQHFGFTHWRDVFTPRQLVAMVTFAGTIKAAHGQMLSQGYHPDRAKAVATCLSMALARLANQCTAQCRWQPEFVAGMLGDAGLPMIMDFAEINPLVDSSGGWPSALTYCSDALRSFTQVPQATTVVRGSALSAPWEDASFDAIVTDPPYYDSRSYSNLSDHFYVWHKRAVGHLYPEHFASQLTPKKTEAIAAPYRHGGSRDKADEAYEGMMQRAFQEARRLLKPSAPMVCVYAHKTTAGWATLINAMRQAGFSVVEAWPIEMERKVRQNALETAALSSSILLVARRREGDQIGSYEREVRPELETIIRERVQTLWSPSTEAAGIQGGDLVIASVGAGLCAFTRFARVEYANGEEVPAERFLAEVETAVLEAILARLSREVGGSTGRYSLEGVDAPTRFYILWRYTYRWTDLDAGEAIIFANGTHVELEGQGSLTHTSRALVEKKKGKYKLRDYADRGGDEKLGLPAEDGTQANAIDVLHRILWLMEKRPTELRSFFQDARPNREQLRLVAQALAGPALRGGELGDISPTAELSALAKLTANWQGVVEDTALTPGQREEKKIGQKQMF